MIQDIAGIIIWTEDMGRLVSFYRDTLELEPHSIHPDFVAFRFGETRLSIGKHSKIVGDAKDPYRIMVNLETNDIKASHHRLRGRGVPFLRSPDQEEWGGWVATFEDPDGNILQLLEQPRQ